MNILFVDQFSDPGGAQFCLRDLIPEILRRGWKAHLMAPGDGEMLKWFRSFDIPTWPLPLKRFTNGRKTPFDFLRFAANAPHVATGIRRAVEKERINLVYVNGPRVLPAAVGVGCPVLFHAHSRVNSPSGRRLIAWSLERAHAGVIAASRFVAQAYSGRFQGKPCSIVYNGVPDLGFQVRSRPRVPARVGILGRISPEKGHLDFVRAARLIPDACFLVYGAPLFSDPVYNQAVRRIAEGAPIEFRGWADNISGALRNLDVLAVPSGPGEASTRVIMEAFSAGVPVVAYRSGGIPEIVNHERTGVLTESADHESLARDISGLLGSPCSMERYSIAGRAEWQLRFRVEQFRATICDLIASRREDGATGDS